jgi:putative glycosyl hydrolase/concanavalin A-like lectin/glucanase superfamily protein/putative Ig domain-containing protein
MKPLISFPVLLAAFAPLASAQTLDIHDAVRTYTTLNDTTVTMTGRAELRVTGTGNPIAGSVIHLDSPDAFLLFLAVPPSQVASTLLSRVRVNGAGASLDGNVRVVQYAQGAAVIPHGPDFAPLEVFDGRYFTGTSRKLDSYVAYDGAQPGTMASKIASFKLKRGYQATLASKDDGTGASRNYVAQDGDLEVGRLPALLENGVRFVRVFPWRWVSKKGIAGNIEANLDVDWLYNWNLDRSSLLDWEYVPIRQNRWWPDLNQNWRTRGATHLLGYNEPDRPDQANLSVGDAIGSWPDLLWTGLRVGAPAVSDGGLGWLYEFISQADAAGLRVDFVPVHYYRCYGNVGDPNGTANQLYGFLKGIHDVVKRPLWVTEWNNGANWTACADPSFDQQNAAVAAMMDMLDNAPFVERYALYNWVEDVRRVKWDDGSLTAAGATYRDQRPPLAYRQEMADAGAGSSAHYSFDGHAHDESGNGQDAMLVGAPVYTAGKHGQAIALNGSTDYLQVSPRLCDSADWSFAGWVLWSGGGSWQRIFDLGLDLSHNLFLTPRSADGFLRFAIQNGTGEQQLNAPALTPGVWTHVAVTIAGNTGKLFVNGAPVATSTGMTINPGDVGTRFNYLGKSQFPADPLFRGRFDDFRFVGSGLPDAQVAAIYGTPPPRFRMSPLEKSDAPAEKPYVDTLAADATGAGPLTFEKLGGPAWLHVAADGALTGTPGPADSGVNSFLVRVTDKNGSMQTATLLIAVPTVTLAVTIGGDDAEQSATGTVTVSGGQLDLGAGSQISGLRFENLSLPPGALIASAHIQFSADEAQGDDSALTIRAQAADHAPVFTTAPNSLSARALTAASVAWMPAPWSSAGERGPLQRTPDVSALVREVIARPGWTNGHAIAFLITGTGHRTADSFEKTGGNPARLTIDFTTPPPLRTVTASVSGGDDDAEQSTTGAVTLRGSSLDLGAGSQVSGLRFEDLSLPPGALIAGADIQFSADLAQIDDTALAIRAEAADHAPTFTAVTNSLSAREPTAASVAWMPAPWSSAGERGPNQRTPDLSALVREVIARPGWTSGNAMVFLIAGTGHRRAESADKLGGLPATLTVSYQTEPPGPVFVRGDSNADGEINISDCIKVFGYLFVGDSPPACLAAANANGDLTLDITDGIFILDYLFLGAREPPPPFPGCGRDPSPEAACAEFPPCR